MGRTDLVHTTFLDLATPPQAPHSVFQTNNPARGHTNSYLPSTVFWELRALPQLEIRPENLFGSVRLVYYLLSYHALHNFSASRTSGLTVVLGNV